MKIQIRTQGFELTPALNAATRNRFYRALRRYEGNISSLELHLKDTNGPRGGWDKLVLARVRLVTGQEIAVEDTRVDLYRAISRCARRTARVVRRSIQKSRRRQPDKLRSLRRGNHLPDSFSLT